MKQIGTAVENFVFKSFDFSGRATLLEYWLMMPLVWGFIIFLFIGDVSELWEFLSRRQKPPLNIFYWDSIIVFLLTIIPRMSLTVRRLHDSGKSGKWVKLPFIATISGFWLVLGLAVLMFMSSPAAQDVGVLMILMATFAGSFIDAGSVDLWKVLFTVTAMINAVGWDAIWAMFAQLMPAQNDITINRGAFDSGESALLGIKALFMVALPFISAFLHIFFMISPSKPDHALALNGPISGASLRRQGDISDNPFAGYKHLVPKTEAQQAAQKARAREEIKSLYQQRVLGSQQPS